MDGASTSLTFLPLEDQQSLRVFHEIRPHLPTEHQTHPLVSVSPWKTGSIARCSCGTILSISAPSTPARMGRPYDISEETEALSDRHPYHPKLQQVVPTKDVEIGLSEREARSVVAYLALYRKLPHKVRSLDIEGVFLTEGIVWDTIHVQIGNYTISVDDETCYLLLIRVGELAPYTGVVRDLVKALLSSDTSIPADHAEHYIVGITKAKSRILFYCSCGATFLRRNFRANNLLTKYGAPK